MSNNHLQPFRARALSFEPCAHAVAQLIPDWIERYGSQVCRKDELFVGIKALDFSGYLNASNGT